MKAVILSLALFLAMNLTESFKVNEVKQESSFEKIRYDLAELKFKLLKADADRYYLVIKTRPRKPTENIVPKESGIERKCMDFLHIVLSHVAEYISTVQLTLMEYAFLVIFKVSEAMCYYTYILLKFLSSLCFDFNIGQLFVLVGFISLLYISYWLFTRQYFSPCLEPTVGQWSGAGDHNYDKKGKSAWDFRKTLSMSYWLFTRQYCSPCLEPTVGQWSGAGDHNYGNKGKRAWNVRKTK